MAQVTLDELKRWLFDCINNARREGLSEKGILIAFLETLQAILEYYPSLPNNDRRKEDKITVVRSADECMRFDK